MSSYKRRNSFTPLEREVIDRAYEVVWETIKERDLFRDLEKDKEPKQQLRRMLFVCAKPGKVDFDQLCDQVLTISAEWVVPPRMRRRSSPSDVGA